jgi:hypothetical protein
MALPSELQYMILSFVPQSEFIPICKNWAEEIKSIQKKAVDKIGSWYKLKKLREDYDTVHEMIRYFVLYYQHDFFLMLPEFTVLKLDLNQQLIDVLPDLVGRKRSDVRDWMMNMPIDLDEWLYVGW